jgi:hypothetical protein
MNLHIRFTAVLCSSSNSSRHLQLLVYRHLLAFRCDHYCSNAAQLALCGGYWGHTLTPQSPEIPDSQLMDLRSLFRRPHIGFNYC